MAEAELAEVKEEGKTAVAEPRAQAKEAAIEARTELERGWQQGVTAVKLERAKGDIRVMSKRPTQRSRNQGTRSASGFSWAELAKLLIWLLVKGGGVKKMKVLWSHCTFSPATVTNDFAPGSGRDGWERRVVMNFFSLFLSYYTSKPWGRKKRLQSCLSPRRKPPAEKHHPRPAENPQINQKTIRAPPPHAYSKLQL